MSRWSQRDIAYAMPCEEENVEFFSVHNLNHLSKYKIWEGMS